MSSKQPPWPFPIVNGKRTADSEAAMKAKQPTPYEKALNRAEEAPL